MKLSKSTLLPLATALGLTLSGLSTASATDRAWNVTTGDFNTGTNWTPTFTTWDSSDNAGVNNGGTATFSSGAVTLAGVRVGQSDAGSHVGTLDITGGSLTTGIFKIGVGTSTATPADANGTATISGSTTTVTVNSTNALGVGINATGKLTLSDSATLTYSASSPVIIGGDNFTSATSNGATGTLEIKSGAQFNSTSSSANLAVGRNKGVGSVLVDGGSLSVAGQINLGAYVGGTSLTGGTGTLTINNGSITANQINVQSGLGTLNFNGGTVTTRAVTKTSAYALAGTAAHFNGSNFVAATTTSNFFNGFATADLDIQSGGLHFNTNGYDVTFAQGLSGVGKLTKTGAGKLTLAGTGTYAGGTLIQGGTLVISANALPGTGDITVATGGSLDVDYDLTLAGGLVLEDGSTIILDQNLTFSSLLIDGTNYAVGIYDYDTLKASYGSIFADGGTGSITVVPEPSTTALSVFGLMGALAWLRFRRQSKTA